MINRTLWERRRRRGPVFFVLVWGVLAWGGSMLVIVSALSTRYGVPMLANLGWRVPLWLGAGFLFGLATWLWSERAYRDGTGAPLGPYSGHDSLDDAISALRRARFRVLHMHHLATLGVIAEGEVVEGTVRSGMVLVAVHRNHPNLLVELAIQSVEFMRHSGGIENVALLLGNSVAIRDADIAEGNVLDVLESSPAA